MKKSILAALLGSFVLSSYGNIFPAGQQLIPADPSVMIAQQGPTEQMAGPAVSYLGSEQPLSQRAPNFEGLDYQAPNQNSVALYYQIQNQILQSRMQEMQWQQHQQMLKTSIDGMTNTFQTYMKSEREANDLFRNNFLQLQQGFFQSFHQEQAKIFAPIMNQNAQQQQMAEQYKALMEKYEGNGDDEVAGTESREDAEAKVENGEISQDEIDEKLKESNTSDA